MDLRLFFRVLRRFRIVAALGFLIAASASFLSYAKVDSHGVHYRTPQLWSSSARVLIAPVQNYAVGLGPDVRTLVPLYANLASSDEVRVAAYARHHIRGGIIATPAFDKDTQASLPILTVSGIAVDPKDATTLAMDGVAALNQYIVSHADAAHQPEGQRVHLVYLNLPSPLTATVTAPRSKTRPIMVFVLGIAATLALLLILENLRPRLREAAEAKRAA